MKKKFIILLTLIFGLLLVSCNNKKEENVVKEQDKTTSVEKGEPSNKDYKAVSYEGTNDKYEAKIIFLPFTDEDEEKIKEKFGEKSDDYLRLQDDRPNYKIKSYVKYIGDGVENIEDTKNVAFEITSNNELLTSTKELNSKEDIVKSLQAQLNVVSEDSQYLHEHTTDVIPLNESTVFNIKVNSNNEELKSTVELKYVAQ